MTARFFILPIVALIALTAPVFAHAPIMGIGGIFGGLLHALMIPEHGMSLMALGLALGGQERGQRRLGVLIFAVTLTCGLAATVLAGDVPFAADALLTTTGILGLLIAIAWVPSLLTRPLAAVAGVVFALDSRPEVTATDEAIRMLIGTGLGAVIALALVAEASLRLQGKAQRIVVRVLGSWIAAIAILDISLRIATRYAVG